MLFYQTMLDKTDYALHIYVQYSIQLHKTKNKKLLRIEKIQKLFFQQLQIEIREIRNLKFEPLKNIFGILTFSNFL
jgi:hypothetical protein